MNADARCASINFQEGVSDRRREIIWSVAALWQVCCYVERVELRVHDWVRIVVEGLSQDKIGCTLL
jgi:hypothetical protein